MLGVGGIAIALQDQKDQLNTTKVGEGRTSLLNLAIPAFLQFLRRGLGDRDPTQVFYVS